jgi:broad specificity phosphatase PhoE
MTVQWPRGMQNGIKFLRDFGAFLALAALTIAIRTVSHAQVENAHNPFTTVIVMRYTDRNRAGDLTAEGRRRAFDLVYVLGGSGIKATYTTDIERTKDTTDPPASCLGIRPEVCGRNLKDLSDKVLSQHKHEVVLVVGHDSAIPGIIEALTGRKIESAPGIQFDDLHIVTIDQSGHGSVLSIK